MAGHYFWATKWPVRVIEEAGARRRGILHLMCEAKPIFAFGGAMGVALIPEPPDGPDTDCRHCVHFCPDIPDEVIENLERSGVTFPKPVRGFMCSLSPAPMNETHGKCRSFSRR